MKGIKLTPFLLFLILLVVLVIAMIFGYYSKPILENMQTNSGNWTDAGNGTISGYDQGTALKVLLAPSSSELPGYYFDPKNANIVVSNNTQSDSFVLITRKSQGVPTTVTTGFSSSSTPGEENMIASMATPWSYSSDNISLLYCPYQTNTFVILIDEGTNKIIGLFKDTNGTGEIMETSYLNGGSEVGISADADLSVYQAMGVPVKETITVNGKNVNTVKIQQDVYFSSESGVIVGKSGSPSVSDEYKNGVGKLNNGGSTDPSDILVLSVMIDAKHILIAIIVKVGSKYQVASSNIVTETVTKDQESSDDSFSISVTTDNLGGNGSDSNSSDSMGDSGNNSNSTNVPDSSNETKPRCPSSSSDNKSDSSDYIKKTEIVPPVCPACPTTNCPISINSKGQIVDCTGKEVNLGNVQGASSGSFSSAPQSFADDAVSSTMNAIGGTAEQTVKSAGDTVQTGLKEAGDALENTVDTAGDALDKGLDTAGGALNTLVGGAENIVGQVGSGIGAAGQGASDLVQGVTGDVADLGKDVINTGGELAYGAGQGVYDLTARQQRLEEEKVQLEKEKQEFEEQKKETASQGQQQGQEQTGYQYGYDSSQQQMGYQYGQPQDCCYQPQYGQGYSYPRTCSSDFMPITNDFSQFT